MFHSVRQKQIFYLLLLCSVLNGLMVLGRLYLNRSNLAPILPGKMPFWTPGYEFLFLVWNLILAWIPYFAALYIGARARKGAPWVRLLPALAVWLFFLPNAPYIITDLTHLHYRPPVPYWYDIVTIYAGATTGLLLGVFAVHEAHDALTRWFSVRYANLIVGASIALSGFGIWLGRFLRFNSWDIVTRPLGMAERVVEGLDSRYEVFQAAAVSFSLATIFGVAFLFLKIVSGRAAP